MIYNGVFNENGHLISRNQHKMSFCIQQAIDL